MSVKQVVKMLLEFVWVSGEREDEMANREMNSKETLLNMVVVQS